MTREEAKALLLNISAYDIDTQRGMKKQEAIEMAIKALEQEPCDKCVYSTSEGCQYDDITETIPPFDDCISRQAVIRIAEQGQVQGYEWQFKELNRLPPVTPQQKTGHWIEHVERDDWDDSEEVWYECDQCHTDWGGAVNFCPNCGAKMQEDEE